MRLPIKLSSFLSASLVALFAQETTRSQGQIEVREVPTHYSKFAEDFERFTVWERGGNGGIAEPTYDGAGGSRALLLKSDESHIVEVFRRLNPHEKWTASFQLKDLTESSEGSWMVGLYELNEGKDPSAYKRAYFAGISGYENPAGVYSTRDDDVKLVESRIRRGRDFHSYAIRCDGSKIYFIMDEKDQGSLPGEFKPGKIYARLQNGGNAILDNVSFEPQ